MTLLEKLNRLPPCLCRIFAKKNGRLMTDEELMEATGWNIKHLRRVYQASCWSRVRVEDVDTFLSACGLRWSSQRRQLNQLWYHQDHFRNMRHLKAGYFWRERQVQHHQELIRKLLSPNHE